MFKKIKKISRKTASMFMVLIMLLMSVANITPTFAASGTGTWIGAQYASLMKTTTNNSSTGILIRNMTNVNTGEQLTVFCAQNHVAFDTGIRYTGQYYVPTNPTTGLACKVAYFGWYSQYGNTIATNSMSAQMIQDYIFTQNMIWEITDPDTTGQFIDSTTELAYVAFKANINAEIAETQQRPSFDGQTITMDAGTSTT